MKVIRLWEHEVKKDIEKCSGKIKLLSYDTKEKVLQHIDHFNYVTICIVEFCALQVIIVEFPIKVPQARGQSDIIFKWKP
jgi:hypothetical protein